MSLDKLVQERYAKSKSEIVDDFVKQEMDIYLDSMIEPDIPEVGECQDVYTDELPVDVDLELLFDVRNTFEVETQTDLRLCQIQNVDDEIIKKLNTAYLMSLDLIHTLKDKYPLSPDLNHDFVHQVKLLAPQVEPSSVVLDGMRHWSVPVTNNITGAFGILLCPSIIGSPLDLFQVFRDFSPCIPFSHKASGGESRLQNVVLPMWAFDYSRS